MLQLSLGFSMEYTGISHLLKPWQSRKDHLSFYTDRQSRRTCSNSTLWNWW